MVFKWQSCRARAYTTNTSTCWPFSGCSASTSPRAPAPEETAATFLIVGTRRKTLFASFICKDLALTGPNADMTTSVRTGDRKGLLLHDLPRLLHLVGA
eukprot:1765093-Pyramimonas_sp.AAC.1